MAIRLADFDASWSPDSKWVTYAKNLKTRMQAIFVYSVADKKAHQITDGMADSISPAFDAGGKYLYFPRQHELRSAHQLARNELDRSSDHTSHLSGCVGSDEPSPFLPETGDEPRRPAAGEEAAKPKTPPSDASVRIDFDGIVTANPAGQRSACRLQQPDFRPGRHIFLH